jgi:lipopolysaccharide transport system ATP-binding protein
MSDILIKAEGVSKKFCKSLKRSMLYGVQDIARNMLGMYSQTGELKAGEFWANDDISFELKRGECLGLIGPNGSGKSTLLKILNGIISPDKGRIEIRGRVGALIEVGAGFHPMLTGRENIYINGSILGFSKKEMDKKFDEIVEFAELDDFIDTPVKHYSSGMRVRLGFAVAAQMKPDLLLVDEVLAVGDLGFTLKCLNWIDATLEGTTFIFVSHSMPMVSRICSDVIVMNHGVIHHQSKDVGSGIATYYGLFASQETLVTYNRDNKSELIEASVVGTIRESLSTIKRLDDLCVKFVFDVDNAVESPAISLFFLDKEQRPIAECCNIATQENSRIDRIGSKKRYEIYLRLKRIQFSAGEYNMTFGLSEGLGAKPLLRVRNAVRFQVSSDRYVWQPFDLEGEWFCEVPRK